MKITPAVTLMLILFIACKKDGIDQNANWKTEEFKYDYSIRFPSNYSGGYNQGFEGGTFEKTRDDARAVFSYNFSNGLQNFDFGDTLKNEAIDSIWVEDGDILVLLPNRLDIIQNDTLAGIFFYNEVSSISRAELYWKDGNVFKDALTVYYADELKEEVITIVNTIEHK